MHDVAARFRNGDLVVCVCVTQARSAAVPKALGACGVDAVCVDLEHTTISIEATSDLCTASLRAGLLPLVRVPDHKGSTIARVLDGGAIGVIVPHVGTATEARAVVEAARLPPLGRRDAFLAGPVPGFRRLPARRRTSDSQTLVFVTVDNRGGVENAGEIAAVAGIDMLVVGAFDLSRDLGCTERDPALAAALADVADACRTEGVGFGVLGLRDAALLADCVARGLCFVSAGTDVALLQDAASAQVSELRNLRTPGRRGRGEQRASSHGSRRTPVTIEGATHES